MAKLKEGSTVGGKKILDENHLAEKATLETLGHVKAETDADGKLILDIPKSNYNAINTPTVNDDSSKGYSIGSRWIDITHQYKQEFACVDDSEGEAVWKQTTNASIEWLYKEGEEYVNFLPGYSNETGEVSKQEDHLFIQVNSSKPSQRTYVTDLGVDLGNIKKIYFEYTITSNPAIEANSWVSLVASSVKEGAIDTYDAKYSKVGFAPDKTVAYMEVDNLKGIYFIRVHCSYGYSVPSHNLDLRVYKIWGER